MKTFRDRIRHIEAELGRHGVAFEWIFEHDADELTPEQIDGLFAASDLKRVHQSLVLKFIETWRLCVERNYRRVLVFEDDVVLGPRFDEIVSRVLDEADGLAPGYAIYLGCGDNKYAPRKSGNQVLVPMPASQLPAADAILFDLETARRRLAYLEGRRVTRPGDWLIREADLSSGIKHYWLKDPVVQQGSMNGRFESSLDAKRTERGRAWTSLRFRWDRWRRRTLGSTRPEAARIDAGDARATVRFDIWAISVARFAAAMTAIGAFVVTGLASFSAGVMVLALLAAPSRWQRLKHAFWQPLGQASLLLLAVLGIATLWSPLDAKSALREWIGWRHFLWLFAALALFETQRSKSVFAGLFALAATVTACASIAAWLADVPVHADPVAPYVIFRNHVTQAMAFAAGVLFAALLALQPETGRRWRLVAWGAAAILVLSLIASTPGRSGYVVLAIVALALALTRRRGRGRMVSTAGVLAALVLLTVASPLVLQRFERGISELRGARQSSELTSMGVRVVIWENTRELIAEAPLLGRGIGSFSREYPRFAAKNGSGWQATPSEDPHNQYLYFLAETGMFGLAAFCWWLLAAARQPVTGPFRAAGLALLLAWCVTSLFSSHFKTFNEGHMIMMFLGVLLAREVDLQASSRPSTAVMTAS